VVDFTNDKKAGAFIHELGKLCVRSGLDDGNIIRLFTSYLLAILTALHGVDEAISYLEDTANAIRKNPELYRYPGGPDGTENPS